MNYNENDQIKTYFEMLRIRLIEETIAEKYKLEQMRCPVHLSIGQEATAVGVLNNFKKQDKIYSTHRCHAHYLAKGGSLKAMISEIHGKVGGCCGGRGGSMHLFDDEAGIIASLPIVGSVIPLAVGSAMTFKLKNLENISAVFFGDGAIEEGVYHESANFAKIHNLPVLFVCENNLYSVYTPINQRQPDTNLTRLADSFGIKNLRCDGNDINKVKSVSKEAVEYIKSKNGPFFLQLDTFRHREHCGPNFDDDLGYRDELEIKSGFTNDPLVLEEKRLTNLSILNEKIINEMKDEIISEIKDAFEFAIKDDFPSITSAEDFVYAN